ncbi:hypothetical protein ABZX77_47460 [Streptomyces sp. NPDC004237]|uniref:Uncharacterized protein n=1 Tax=Streptomyces sp. R39 TaxID=3238631 RepID=A0AB39R863_9ACTN
MAPAEPHTTCYHVIAHWVTDDERQKITDAIDYARRVGDLEALPLLLLRLTAPCSARDTYREHHTSSR